jgi:hypothetical protein
VEVFTVKRMVGILLFVLVGCNRSATDLDAARSHLIAQADEVGRAMIEKDHNTMARLTNPAIIEAIGGRTKFIEAIQKVENDAQKTGIRFTGIRMSEPSPILESSGQLYATAPYVLSFKGPGGAEETQSSFLLGISTSGGKVWTFVDGQGVTKNPGAVRQLLKLPAELELPPKQSSASKTN